MSAAFWDGPIYKIVKKMKAGGNQPGVISLWKNMVGRWAECAAGPDAEAVKAFLPLWQVRPYYTAKELVPIFPALAVALGLRKQLMPQMSPARLANALKYAGLPYFIRDGETYFVVEQCHRAKEFENEQP